MVTVSGWQRTHPGFKTKSLLVAEIKMRDHAKCASEMREVNTTVTSNMICAGGSGDPCRWDPGSPLTYVTSYKDQEEQRYLGGIGSWGYRCDRDYPAVFTDVANYQKWIERSKCKGKNALQASVSFFHIRFKEEEGVKPRSDEKQAC